jgi:dTDP-4-amino-4,6-dideoxygalactose transaminase
LFPRLALDIGWRDLASLARRPPQGLDATLTRFAPDGAHLATGLSARSLFDALLAELALPPGAEVAMSAVNIEGMAQIVRAHGLTVRPIDLEPGALAPTPAAVSAALGPRSGLVLLAHLYGARTETREIAAVCRARGVPLVEDCAQAFDGALTLGVGADVALYSFGPIKTATALGGGLALIRDNHLAERVRARLAAYRPLSDGWFLRRTAKYALLKTLNRPRAYGLVLGAIRAAGHDPESVIGGLARGFAGGDLLARIRRAPPPRLLALLARRLRDAAPPHGRQARAEAVLGALRQPLAAAVPRAPGATWWLCPVLSHDPDRLVAELRRLGFDATRGATSLRALEAPAASAPQARRLMREVVYLPVTPYLTGEASRRLAAAVRRIEGVRPEDALHSEAVTA